MLSPVSDIFSASLQFEAVARIELIIGPLSFP